MEKVSDQTPLIPEAGTELGQTKAVKKKRDLDSEAEEFASLLQEVPEGEQKESPHRKEDGYEKTDKEMGEQAVLPRMTTPEKEDPQAPTGPKVPTEGKAQKEEHGVLPHMTTPEKEDPQAPTGPKVPTEGKAQKEEHGVLPHMTTPEKEDPQAPTGPKVPTEGKAQKEEHGVLPHMTTPEKEDPQAPTGPKVPTEGKTQKEEHGVLPHMTTPEKKDPQAPTGPKVPTEGKTQKEEHGVLPHMTTPEKEDPQAPTGPKVPTEDKTKNAEHGVLPHMTTPEKEDPQAPTGPKVPTEGKAQKAEHGVLPHMTTPEKKDPQAPTGPKVPTEGKTKKAEHGVLPHMTTPEIEEGKEPPSGKGADHKKTDREKGKDGSESLGEVLEKKDEESAVDPARPQRGDLGGLPGDVILQSLQAAVGSDGPARAEKTDTPPSISKVAQEIADRILVSDGSSDGKEEVRIHLKEAVLPDTEIRISKDGDKIRVDLMTTSNDSNRVLTEHRGDLQTALKERVGDTVSVVVQYHDSAGEHHDGRSRERRNLYEEMVE